MGVTRLERKGRKNKSVSKRRTANIKLHQQKPVIKNVDIEAIKAEFEANKSKPAKAAPKKEEVKAEVASEVAAPKKEAEARVKEKEAKAVKKE